MGIEEYLKKNQVDFQMHDHPTAYTAQEVAQEEHVSGNMLAKTVVVCDGNRSVLCVLPASFKLDMAKVAKIIRAKKVRLADEKKLAELFPDVEVGAEPPFGNLYDMDTLVDEHLAADKEIVFRAGSHQQAIRMKYADYAALVNPSVSDLAVRL